MRVIAALAILLIGCQPKQPVPGAFNDSDGASIRETYAAFAAAGTSNEYTRMGRFFTEDAVWIPRAGPSVEGRSAFEKWFTVRATEVNYSVLEVHGKDDLAYTRASFRLNLDLPGFTPVTGTTLAIWKKQADGTWLIARHAESCNAPCR